MFDAQLGFFSIFIEWAFGIGILLFLCLWFWNERLVEDYGRRYILVTGCDCGVGRDLVIQLDQKDCHVIAGCLTDAGVSCLNSATSDRCVPFKFDVTDSKAVAAAHDLVKTILPENLGLWGVVNNAGESSTGLIRWLTKKDYELCMNVNLYGTIDVTTTFLPLVRKEGGRVVNMSSMLGLFPLPGNTAYCVSKCAVEAFSDILRREIKDISVCLIEPGVIRTSIATAENVERTVLEAWENAPSYVKEEDQAIACQAAEMAKRRTNTFKFDGTHLVVDTCVRALFSRRPRTRYVIGGDAKLFQFLSILPTYLADWALRLIRG